MKRYNIRFVMCIGESGSDTLEDAELSALAEAAGRYLPGYVCSVHSNDDSITWAVLNPNQTGAQMPRFTVCRIDPCIMVMVEDRAERRFSSMPDVEQAIAFACHTVAQTALALANIHERPRMAQ